MATTLDQQVALDEALVPNAQRLWIGRSNFRLPSDIQSKEPTLQVVYDVLMEHKNQKKSNEMYYPRFTKVIIDYFMTRKPSIPRRNSVNWHYVRDEVMFSTIKVVSRHQTTQQYGAILPIELTTAEIRNIKAYKEYHACAMGEAAPKLKASARKKKGDSASTTPPTPTPTTTVESAPRLSATAKGKQPSRATTPIELTDVQRTEAEQLKIILKRSRQETHISQQSGSGTDEGIGSKPGQRGSSADEGTGSRPRVLDVSSNDSEEELSWNYFDDEDVDVQDEGDKNDESDNGIFRFEDRVKSLEDNFSNIPGIVNQYMNQQMPEAVQEAMQTQTNQLQDSIQRENDEFLKTINENMKKIIKEQVKSQVKAQVTRILPRIEEAVNAQLEAEVLTRSSHSSRNSYAIAADLSEMELKKILIEKMEGNKTTTWSQSRQLSTSDSAFAEEPVQPTCQIEEPSHPVFETGMDDQPIVQTSQHPEWFSQPSRPPTPDRDWNKSVPAAQGEAPSWISALAKQTDARSSFNELLDTPIDFSNFIMNRLGVDTLTLELLADQLDWVNPEGQQYPHNLLQPLPLILDNRGRSVIPFEHFINNHLEYLRGGASSRKYTTSVTKTKAADYGHIKWIEDLHFYGFTVNRESALDVYSKRRIIAVTELKIVEWHNYKHLDWISVRRDDDKIYKFKEGDLKRLCIQVIEVMLLLLVQGKLSNLTVEEHFAFNVSLRMFTRSIVIQRRVEDLQLGVESYQKRLNLTRPDTYRSDLKRHEAYTAHSNPRGFIYQNKDKKNRLMRIDELYKFSDETLNDVRNALNDRLKGIRMQYLPSTIWKRGDKTRAAAMIQAIDKMLKTRRIIRSLERFVGG
nr:hypothetical protein [Tanacetum cinerariifolium]